MIVAITGAAGFIGSRLLETWRHRLPAKDLLAVDHPIVSAKQDNLAVAPDVTFMDHHQFLAALESGNLQPGLILHMGACSSTTETDWNYLSENNVGYSQRLWNWCAQHHGRLIYASSAATYGDGSRGFDDEADIHSLRPPNLYGQSKQDFDLWVQERLDRSGAQPVQCVGLKFFNVYGPGESHKGRMASMVFHGFNQIREQGRVRLFKSHHPDYEDGGQLRDFIYVRDVVAVIESLAARPDVNGLFNLGSGKAASFRELIVALFAALDRESRIEYFPIPADLRDRYQYFTQASMTKLARAGIPFTPTPLPVAVADYVRWLHARVAHHRKILA